MEKEELKDKVLKKIENSGHKAWFVGGCVRDKLMGVTPRDYDIATDATPNELHKIFSFFSNVSDNSEHFGVTMPLVQIDGKIEEIEIATLRRDITKGRHPKIEYTRNIKEDAFRRDFTVNALYEDIDGNVIDPTGIGVKDCEDKVLRFVGNAQDRITEDPLRVFRFVRFLASKGFKSAYETKEVLEWKYDLEGVSKERKLKELEKTLGGKYLFSGDPSPWIYLLATRVLYDIGFAKVMVALKNVEQSWMWHSEGAEYIDEDGKTWKAEDIKDFSKMVPISHGNAWDHTLRVMKNMSEYVKDMDEHTRFVMMMAAFLHDIGKYLSTLGFKTNKLTFNGKEVIEVIPKVSDHDRVGAPIAYDFCKNLGMNNDDSKLIRGLVFYHMQMHQIQDFKSKKRVWELTSLPYFDKLVLLAKADENGCIKTSTETEWSGIEGALEAPFVKETLGKPMPKPIVDGNFLIAKGNKPGPKFSKKLDVALKMQIDKGMTDPEAIYKIIKSI